MGGGGGEGNIPLPQFFYENFLHPNLKIDEEELFDIILIHDVIEHIEARDKSAFFQKVKKYMRSDALVFWRFPSWHMPFGGHQQICQSKILSKMPFLHLLPLAFYRQLLIFGGERNRNLQELMSIRRSRMTVDSFTNFCESTGHKIIDSQLWLINPHYQAKFNLRPRLLPALLNIPYIRNFCTSSCFFLTQKEK